jgi:hypothetical protein
MHATGFHRAAQGRTGRHEAALAHHFFNRGRAHALGQGLQAFGRLEQARAGGFVLGHGAIVA